MGELHYHVRDKKRTYAWSYSEQRALARCRADNTMLKLAGRNPVAQVFACQAYNCYVVTGTERD